MNKEAWNYKNEPTLVVGGGEFGTRAGDGLKRGLGIKDLTICDIGDPIQDLLERSRIAFFATEEDTTKDILISARDKLHGLTLIEGASTKGKIIPILEDLDQNDDVSGVSVHLGIKTDNSWRGARVWVCRIGPNSDRAILVADDLFSYFNTQIIHIGARDHINVQKAQVHTFIGQLTSAISLKNRGITLEELDTSATANSQLNVLSTARGVGQPAKIVAEVLGNQPDNAREVIDSSIEALQQLGDVISDRNRLQEFIESLQEYHGSSTGKLKEMFGDSDLLIQEVLRIAMYNLDFSTQDDTPGSLLRLLGPFAGEHVNLAAVASKRIAPSKEEIQHGKSAIDETLVFKVGVDKETIDPQKEEGIYHQLEELGCEVNK